MFVRKKTINGKVYHYLVESVRTGSSVQQKVLAYLGTHDNVEDAYKSATGAARRKLAQYRKGKKS
jgi:hypothetical protein